MSEQEIEAGSAGPTPDETGEEGQKPVASEGQEPEAGATPEEGQEPSEERTYSQSYVKQLRRENAERRERLAELEAQMKEQEDAEKSELQKTQEALAKEVKKREALELKQIRTDVAAEQGLAAKAAEFLHGSTREEIEHHAEELGKLLRQGKPASGFDGGAREKAPPTKKAPEQEHNELLLRAIGRMPQERES